MSTPSDNIPNQKYTDTKTGIEWTRTQVRGRSVRVGRLDGEVVDVQAKMTDRDFRNMVCQFDNRNAHYQTSCFTYIFQTQLTSFEKYTLEHPKERNAGLGDLAHQLRRWSSFYADLEEMMNNPSAFADPMGELIKRLEKIVALIEKEVREGRMPEHIADQLLNGSKMKRVPSFMNDRRSDGLLNFLKEAKNLRNKSPTNDEVRKFFAVQSEEAGAPCLGRFVCNQMWILTKRGLAESRFRQYKAAGFSWTTFRRGMYKRQLDNCLIDAQANIIRKGKTLDGVVYNNSRDPVDPGMVNALRYNDNPDNYQETYTSITDYVDCNGDLGQVDQLFKALDPATFDKKEKHKSPGFIAQSLVFLGNIVELGLTLAIRLPVNIVVGVGHLFARIPGILFGDKYNRAVDNFFKSVDEGISKIHHTLSSFIGVVGLKKWRDKRTYSEQLNSLSDPQSGYNAMARSLGGSVIGKFLGDAVQAVVYAPFQIAGAAWDGLKGFFRSKKAEEARRVDLANGFQKQANEAYALVMKIEVPIPAPDSAEAVQVRRGVQPWAKNEFTQPLVFFRDIMIALSDELINPMFNHNPAAATFFFLMAHASMGTMMASAALPASTQAAQHVLMVYSKIMAKDFMGKVVAQGGTGMTDAMFTGLLDFKVPMLFVEVIQKMARGETEFLNHALANPEKATVFLLAFVGGTAIFNYLPQLQLPEVLPESVTHFTFAGHNYANPPMEFMNVIIEETAMAQEHGQYPATSIEFAFVAYKLGSFAKDMLVGEHDAAHKGEIDQAELKERQLAAKLLLAKYVGTRRLSLGECKGEPCQQSLIDVMRKKLSEYLEANKLDPKNIGLKDLPDEVLREQIILPALRANGIQSEKILNLMADRILADVKSACVQAKEVNQKVQQQVDALQQMNNEGQKIEPTDKKRARLMELITAVQQYEMAKAQLKGLIELNKNNPDELKKYEDQLHKLESSMTLEKANALYDELYYAFKDYNEEQRKLGRWDRMLSKEAFMHGIDNLYIEPHERSTPVVALFRAPFAWLAGQRSKNLARAGGASPHRQERIRKRAATESAWMMAIPGTFFRAFGVAYGQGISNGITATFLGVPAGILTGVYSLVVGTVGRLATWAARPFVGKDKAKGWWDAVTDHLVRVADRVVDTITFSAEERDSLNSLNEEMRAKQARNARRAGLSSEHMAPEAENLLKQLEQHEAEDRAAPPQNQNQNQAQKVGESVWLQDYKRKYAKRDWKSSKSNRRAEKEILTRYARAMTHLDHQVKDLMRRIEVLNNLSQKDPELKGLLQQLQAVESILEGYKKDGPKNPADWGKMEERLRHYETQVEGMVEIDKRVKAKEQEVLAKITRGVHGSNQAEMNQAPVQQSQQPIQSQQPQQPQQPQQQQPSVATACTAWVSTSNHSNATTADVQNNLQNSVHLSHMNLPKNVQAALISQKGYIVVGVDSDGQCDIFASQDVQLSPARLVELLKKHETQIQIGDEMVHVQAVLGKDNSVSFMKCIPDVEGDVDLAPITEEDLKTFNAQNPGKNLVAHVTCELSKSMTGVTVVDKNGTVLNRDPNKPPLNPPPKHPGKL